MIPSTTDSTAALIWGTFYVIVIATEMRCWIRAGSSIADLIQGGFREIPALQWLLQSACAIAVVSIVVECVSVLSSGSLRGRTVLDSVVPIWALCVVLMIGAAAIAIALFAWVEHSRIRGTTTDFSTLGLVRSIRPDENATGTAKSDVKEAPEEALPQWDEWRALEIAGIGLLALAAVLQFPSSSSASAVRAIDEVARFLASEVPPAALRAALFPATVCLGVLTVDRGIPLTLSRSRRRLLRFGLLIFVALCGATLVADDPVHPLSPCVAVLGMLGIGLVGIAIREEVDAKRTRARQEADQLRGVLAAGFPDFTRELESVAGSGSIPLLSQDEVRARVETGLARVEAQSRLIPRFMGRLMKITEVAATPVATMSLRFLTVRRRITLDTPKPTKEKRRHPSVDVWDADEFPINPPSGYGAGEDQRITLPAEYDVIKACRHCGGSGHVWEEESYFDSETYTDADGETQWQTVTRTRSVLETCHDCSGTGSLRYRQVIVTSWKPWQPTLQSSTSGPTRDMFEETSELDVRRCPLVENFEPTTEVKPIPPSPSSWGTWFQRAADRARQLSDRNDSLVADQFGGRVYRSELVVSITHAVRIGYTGLPGGSAWFAGCPPKSHFRRLPLAWSTLFASALLPPLAAYGLIEAFALAHAFFSAVMRK